MSREDVSGGSGGLRSLLILCRRPEGFVVVSLEIEFAAVAGNALVLLLAFFCFDRKRQIGTMIRRATVGGDVSAFRCQI
jgi:hypothetical protein